MGVRQLNLVWARYQQLRFHSLQEIFAHHADLAGPTEYHVKWTWPGERKVLEERGTREFPGVLRRCESMNRLMSLGKTSQYQKCRLEIFEGFKVLSCGWKSLPERHHIQSILGEFVCGKPSVKLAWIWMIKVRNQALYDCMSDLPAFCLLASCVLLHKFSRLNSKNLICTKCFRCLAA